MTPRETKTLLKLVEQNETIATELPTALAELANKEAVDTEQVSEVTAAALTRIVEMERDPKRVTDGLPDLLAAFPELPAHTIEPLSQMAIHDNAGMRLNGIRCLGFVGAYEPAHREFVAEQVTDALTDENTDIQQAALWSLTKIGLAAPDMLTSRRDQLAKFLASRPQDYEHADETSAIRRYAVEALGVNALGTITVDNHYPEDDSLNNSAAVAAWAIQRSVEEHGLEVDGDRQIAQTTDVEDDHAVAPLVASALAQTIEHGERKAAAGAVLALGYLVPWQSDLSEYVELLNEVIDRDQEHAEAAKYVLTNGPFTPAYSEITNLSKDAAFELEAAPVDRRIRDESWKRSHIGVSYDVEDELFVTGSYNGLSGTVELAGRNTAPARIRLLHHEDDYLRLTDQLRRELGVEYGDTVAVRATPTVAARKVVLSLPENAPIAREDMASKPVREEIATQRYTVGDPLLIRVVTDRDRLEDECMREMDWFFISNDVIQECTQHLPVRVESTFPEAANRVTRNTEIVVERTDDIDFELSTTADGPKRESLTPLSIFREEIEPNMCGNAIEEPIDEEDKEALGGESVNAEEMREAIKEAQKERSTMGEKGFETSVIGDKSFTTACIEDPSRLKNLGDPSAVIKAIEERGYEVKQEEGNYKVVSQSEQRPMGELIRTRDLGEQEEFDPEQAAKRILRESDGDIPQDVGEETQEYLREMKEEMDL